MKLLVWDSESNELEDFFDTAETFSNLDIYEDLEDLVDEVIENDIVVLDLDAKKKAVEKSVKKLKKTCDDFVLIYLTSTLDGKKLEKHKKSKLGGDLYITLPIEASELVSLLSPFVDEEISIGISKENQELLLKQHTTVAQISPEAQKKSDKLDAIFSSVLDANNDDNKESNDLSLDQAKSSETSSEDLTLPSIEDLEYPDLGGSEKELSLGDEAGPDLNLSLDAESDLEVSLEDEAESDLNLSLGDDAGPDLDLSLGDDAGPDLDLSLGDEAESDLDLSLGDEAESDLDLSLGDDAESDLDLSLSGDAEPDLDLRLGGEAESDLDLSPGDESELDLGLSPGDESELDLGLSLDGDEAETNLGDSEEGERETDLSFDSGAGSEMDLSFGNEDESELDLSFGSESDSGLDLSENDNVEPEVELSFGTEENIEAEHISLDEADQELKPDDNEGLDLAGDKPGEEGLELSVGGESDSGLDLGLENDSGLDLDIESESGLDLDLESESGLDLNSENDLSLDLGDEQESNGEEQELSLEVNVEEGASEVDLNLDSHTDEQTDEQNDLNIDELNVNASELTRSEINFDTGELDTNGVNDLDLELTASEESEDLSGKILSESEDLDTDLQGTSVSDGVSELEVEEPSIDSLNIESSEENSLVDASNDPNLIDDKSDEETFEKSHKETDEENIDILSRNQDASLKLNLSKDNLPGDISALENLREPSGDQDEIESMSSMSDDAIKKLAEIDQFMSEDIDKEAEGIKGAEPKHDKEVTETTLSTENDHGPTGDSNDFLAKEINALNPDYNPDLDDKTDIISSESETKVEETKVEETKVEEGKLETKQVDAVARGQNHVRSDDLIKEHKEVINSHNEELVRLGETIKNLREDRERLLSKVYEYEKDKASEKQSYVDLSSELDEKRIELSITIKRFEKNIDHLKYQLEVSQHKKSILEEKNKKLEKEIIRIGQEGTLSGSKIKARESELESQLELLRADSQTQIKNRDHKILELKRRIDTLEFDIETMYTKERKVTTSKNELEDKLDRVIKTLRSAISDLENDEDSITYLKQIKNNLDI